MVLSLAGVNGEFYFPGKSKVYGSTPDSLARSALTPTTPTLVG